MIFNTIVDGKDFERTYVERRALSVFKNNTITRIGDYAFWRYSTLTSINLPQVSYIGSGAFGYCSALTLVSLP